MKLSKITIAYGLYIIISASFIQQVWKFFGEAAGEGNVKRGGIFLFCALSFFILRRIVKFHFSATRLIFNTIILFASFIFAWSKPIFVEKMHVIEYGILGWLAVRDSIHSAAPKPRPLVRGNRRRSVSTLSKPRPLGRGASNGLIKTKGTLKSVSTAVLYILLVGILDEAFQKILPYRVGEVRDVIINLISGAFGIALFLAR